MTYETGTDPIWGITALVNNRGYIKDYLSDRTGNFTVDEGLSEYLRGWMPADRAKLSTWILDRNRGGEQPVIEPQMMDAIYERPRLSMNQKIDRFLTMLDTTGFRPGDELPWRGGVVTEESLKAKHQTMLWIEAATDGEFAAFRAILEDAGIIRGELGRLQLGYNGFERLERLNRGGQTSDQAFVAMWFDQTMSTVYDNGIEPAIIEAGYRPIRIDRKEHNNKVDDEIIAEIRRSRFVLADFTCGTLTDGGRAVAVARGGVYYEAGFAQGLGIDVIWSVRSDQIGLVHFDTRQFNHLVWTDEADLRRKLFNRIAASIGERRRTA